MPVRIDESFPPFLKSLKRLRKKFRTIDSDMALLFKVLAVEPSKGDLVAGMQSLLEDDQTLFKVRVKTVGHGKSGGPRLLYLVSVDENALFPLLLYLHPDYSAPDIPDGKLQEIVADFRSYIS
ncbi:hypothetical protein [Candidatus Deferrimicrobium sp.]|uniref:hypothetical protein n=1 Tax=Candidatus Deferrimicrobium sp. TaxID=3060586 RepID=UPI002717A622|nr:hypothetical protein [Candidatus Deferrimicrobium sp.]MDO8738216.1 hypothetical protein [Candidatus Deferrimicrobium sp.]